uniref:Uncharacterized protein n=1 Tax=Arundo donax TaxID=35708 RepID=A0A0A8YH02_ARUDO
MCYMASQVSTDAFLSTFKIHFSSIRKKNLFFFWVIFILHMSRQHMIVCLMD